MHIYTTNTPDVFYKEIFKKNWTKCYNFTEETKIKTFESISSCSFLPVSCLQVAKWDLVLLPNILKFKSGDYLKTVKCVW